MDPTRKQTRVAKCKSRGSWLNMFRCSSSKQRDDDFYETSRCSESGGVCISALESEKTERSSPSHAKRLSFFSRVTGTKPSSKLCVSMPVIVLDEAPKRDMQTARVKPEPKKMRGRPRKDSKSPEASHSQLSIAATRSPVKHSARCEVYPESCRASNDSSHGGRCRNGCERERADKLRPTCNESDKIMETESSRLETRTGFCPSQLAEDTLCQQNVDSSAKCQGSAMATPFQGCRDVEKQSQEVSMNASISRECIEQHTGLTKAHRALSPLQQDRDGTFQIPRLDSVTTSPVEKSKHESSLESWGLRKLLQSLVGSSVAPSISSVSSVGTMDVNRVLHASTSLGDGGTGRCCTAPSGRVVNDIGELSAMKKPAQGELVWLNIYDVQKTLQLVNDLAKQVGSGAFHAGVEVYGQEWSFGWKEYGSGVYCSTPMRNERHKYRESVSLGATLLRSEQVSNLIFRLRQEWMGKEYELLTRNCCHFADAMCSDLAVGRVPEWVMHLASAGVSFVEGVDHAVLHAQKAAEMAVNKAAEFDERFQISRKVDSFLQQEIDIDEAYLEEAARGLFSKAMEKLDSVGALAGQVFNDVEDARRRLSARDIFVQPHDKEDSHVFCHSVSALSPTPARGNRNGDMIRSPITNLQGVPVVDTTNVGSNFSSHGPAYPEDDALEILPPPEVHQDQESAELNARRKDTDIASSKDFHEEQQLAEPECSLSEDNEIALRTVFHKDQQSIEFQCSQNGQKLDEQELSNGTSTV